METLRPAIDETYLESVDRLIQHHGLLVGGKETTADAIAVADEMTELRHRLDAGQRKSRSGLGSDLNWVRRGGTLAPRGPTPEDGSSEDRQALEEARNASDWHRFLHQVRICAPSVPVMDLARLRAEAWSKLGQPRIACVFDEFFRLKLWATSPSSKPSE